MKIRCDHCLNEPPNHDGFYYTSICHHCKEKGLQEIYPDTYWKRYDMTHIKEREQENLRQIYINKLAKAFPVKKLDMMGYAQLRELYLLSL